MRLPITGHYPDDWREISERVKDQAGRRCIRCGHPEGDRLKGEQKIFQPCADSCTHPKDGKLRQLTVHHLDGNKSNCRWWNLLALCQFCHLSVQGRVIPERPFLWEHTAWFKPYAAGFYAWWFGGQQITRAEAEAEQERWLAVGQPWLYPEVKQ